VTASQRLFGVVKVLLCEQSPPGDGGVDGPCVDLLLRHVQLKAAQVLARGRVRRPAEEGRERSDVPDVGVLHLLAKTARRHVIDHA